MAEIYLMLIGVAFVGLSSVFALSAFATWCIDRYIKFRGLSSTFVEFLEWQKRNRD